MWLHNRQAGQLQSSTMNQKKMWELWRGGVNCQDRLSQCTSPCLPYTDPTPIRCQRSSTGKNNGWLNAPCHQIANSLPNCLENHPGMMNQDIHIPLAHWNYQQTSTSLTDMHNTNCLVSNSCVSLNLISSWHPWHATFKMLNGASSLSTVASMNLV